MAIGLGDREQQWVSVERGEIDRRIFSDLDIFEKEMELLFGRAWLFVGHESQFARPGDFFEAPMGRDNVLVVRQSDGQLAAFINSCTHRGNAVCRAEEGNTKNFMCTYHGWTYDLGGRLIGVPGFENLYHGDLDKDALALRRVAQLDTYRGFVFATMDPGAPRLSDYLGATARLAIDLFSERGEMQIIPGIQKYSIDCNWKFATDNIIDYYHGRITHMSAYTPGVMPGRQDPDAAKLDQEKRMDQSGATTPDGKALELVALRTNLDAVTILGEYGHAIGGPTTAAQLTRPDGPSNNAWRLRPEVEERLGHVGSQVAGHANVFPNLWITGSQVFLRTPRSPNSTEFWSFSFVDKNATAEQRNASARRSVMIFGPAGFLEQEDGENWSQATRQTMGLESQKIPQLLKMNLGRGKIVKEHGLARIESVTSEHSQLWTYAAWAQYVTGSSWDVIKANTTPGEFL